jgi:hypothetical protein
MCVRGGEAATQGASGLLVLRRQHWRQFLGPITEDLRPRAPRTSSARGVRAAAVGERFFGPLVAGKPVQIVGNPDLLHTHTYVPDFGEAMVRLSEMPEAWERRGASRTRPPPQQGGSPSRPPASPAPRPGSARSAAGSCGWRAPPCQRSGRSPSCCMSPKMTGSSTTAATQSSSTITPSALTTPSALPSHHTRPASQPQSRHDEHALPRVAAALTITAAVVANTGLILSAHGSDPASTRSGRLLHLICTGRCCAAGIAPQLEGSAYGGW